MIAKFFNLQILAMIFFATQIIGQNDYCMTIEALIKNETFKNKFSDCLNGDTILIVDTSKVFHCFFISESPVYIITDVWPNNFNINNSFGYQYDNILILTFFSSNEKINKIGILSPSTHLHLVFESRIYRKRIKIKLIHEGIF